MSEAVEGRPRVPLAPEHLGPLLKGDFVVTLGAS